MPETWGVTVAEVSALAPHVPIGPTPEPTDPVFGGRADRRITTDEVEQWIADVSARADAALIQRTKLSTEDQERITTAVHDLVVNGAASYLVAAAFPAKAGVNDNTSYSGLLWDRFVTGLAELSALVADLIEVVVTTEAVLPIRGYFPPTRFPDSLQW